MMRGILLSSVLALFVRQAASGSEFLTIAEALTASSSRQGLEAHQRMFTLSILAEACKGKGTVSKLVKPNAPVALTEGNWFALSRMAINAVDGSGRRLASVPIFIDVETKTPPLFNWDPEKRVDASILPIRTGSFNFRAHTICPGSPALEIVFPAVVRQKRKRKSQVR